MLSPPPPLNLHRISIQRRRRRGHRLLSPVIFSGERIFDFSRRWREAGWFKATPTILVKLYGVSYGVRLLDKRG